MISEQLSVNSNENEHVTDAENSSDNSDQSINGPTASGSPKHNDDAVSVIIESNFDLLDKASVCLTNTNDLISILFFIVNSRFDMSFYYSYEIL